MTKFYMHMKIQDRDNGSPGTESIQMSFVLRDRVSEEGDWRVKIISSMLSGKGRSLDAFSYCIAWSLGSRNSQTL